MRVIINEIKKLFSIKTIIGLCLIIYIVGEISIGSNIRSFAYGQSTGESFNLRVDMLNKYGITMDKNELEDFKKDTAPLEKEVNKYLLNNKYAKELGITSYEELGNACSKGDPNIVKKMELVDKIKDQNEALFSEIDARESIISSYEGKSYWGNNGDTAKDKRMNDIESSEQFNSLIDFSIFDNYNQLIAYFGQLVVISVAFIVSPIFLKDNRNKMNLLQYPSKEGRRLAKKKVVSSMIVAFSMTTIELIGLFVAYSQNNTLQFWNCSINSRFTYIKSWFDLTFGEYIILSILLLYIVTFVVASLSLFISSKVKSYVALIGIQVPVLAGLILLLEKIGLLNITTVTLPKYTIHILYTILFLIAALMIRSLLKKEKQRDILN